MQKNLQSQTVVHNILPVYNEHSRILILGSFPSVKSREQNFFYGNKQNRFWNVLANIFNEMLPQTVEQKKLLLLNNYVAIWDVINTCQIVGSSDSSIKNVVPNDLSKILLTTKIEKIFCNGGCAYKLYQKYMLSVYKINAVKLPSTSSANASFSFEKLVKEWAVIRNT